MIIKGVIVDIKVVAGDIAGQDVGAVVVNLFEGVTAPGGGDGRGGQGYGRGDFGAYR